MPVVLGKLANLPTLMSRRRLTYCVDASRARGIEGDPSYWFGAFIRAEHPLQLLHAPCHVDSCGDGGMHGWQKVDQCSQCVYDTFPVGLYTDLSKRMCFFIAFL